MLGVAYEMSAVFNRPLKPLAFELARTKDSKQEEIKFQFKKTRYPKFSSSFFRCNNIL